MHTGLVHSAGGSQENIRKKQMTVVSEWVLFLIHPLTSVVTAFSNYKSSNAKNIFWLFIAFYGFTMVISDEEMDANRYREQFIELTKTEVTTSNFVSMLYQEESNYVDVAQPLLGFIVSRFTNDPRILFAAFGLVFGFFYSRNIWFLLERSGKRIKGSSIIYLLVFSVVIGFWSINGFRMWTAAQIFFFGSMKYLFENNKNGILIAASSILFHFSFMFPVSILLVFTAIPRNAAFLYWFFIISSFLSEINIELISNALTHFLPGVFHQHIQGYTSLEYVESISTEIQTRNWRFLLYSKSIKWVAILFLSVIYFNGRKFILENKPFQSLFCYAILLMAATNLMNNIPSMGRFYLVAYLFVFALIFLYLQQAPSFKLKGLALTVAFPFLVFYCVGMINGSFATIGLLTLFGNPVCAILPFGVEGNTYIGLYLQ